MCFRESHDRASRKGKNKTRFLFFFLSRESRFCFRERHGCAFVRVTAVPLGKGKTKRVFFFFTRVTVLLPREARLCFCESHGPASRKGKKIRVFWFFSFARVTVLLLPEARLCFRESHGRASFGKGKKRVFYFFFFPRESRFCFHERHGCDFARGTGVPLSEREKTVLPVWFFRPVFS